MSERISKEDFKQAKIEAKRSGIPLINITKKGHFYLAYKGIINGILNRQKAIGVNKNRGEANYEAIVKIAKDENIDLIKIKKASLVATFEKYFNEEGKKPGKYNLNPLKEGQLYTNVRRFRSEQTKK